LAASENSIMGSAAGLIIECAGGEFFREPVEGEHTYRIITNNGLLRRPIEKLQK
jgi:hypothetical protein